MVAAGCQRQNCVGYCCSSGSERQSCNSSFQRRYSLLENVLCGVGQSAVNISGVSQAKTVSRVLAAVEHIRCRLINRNCTGIRNRICLFLSYVKLKCIESKLMLCH